MRESTYVWHPGQGMVLVACQFQLTCKSAHSWLSLSRPGLSTAGLSWLVLNLIHTQGGSHWFCAGSGWGLPLMHSFNPHDNLCRQGQLPSPSCSWENWGSAGKVPWLRSWLLRGKGRGRREIASIIASLLFPLLPPSLLLRRSLGIG